jgi:hypothetical protein
MSWADKQALLDVAETFSIVVVYEDSATRDRAIRVCDHVKAQVKEVELKFSWWRFDFLSDPKLAELAAKAAARADMVIFSAHDGKALPPPVRDWIETWLPRRKQKDSALMALIGAAETRFNQSTPARTYLHAVATRARMDYLPEPVLALPEEQFGSVDSILKRVETITPVLRDILNHERIPTRWGLNE